MIGMFSFAMMKVFWWLGLCVTIKNVWLVPVFFFFGLFSFVLWVFLNPTLRHFLKVETGNFVWAKVFLVLISVYSWYLRPLQWYKFIWRGSMRYCILYVVDGTTWNSGIDVCPGIDMFVVYICGNGGVLCNYRYI